MAVIPKLSDLAADDDDGVQEYYNLPEDDELAAGLEVDRESPSPPAPRVRFPSQQPGSPSGATPGYMKSTKSVSPGRSTDQPQPAVTTGKKKLQPREPSSQKHSRLSGSSDNYREEWGEGGFYHDGEPVTPITASPRQTPAQTQPFQKTSSPSGEAAGRQAPSTPSSPSSRAAVTAASPDNTGVNSGAAEQTLRSGGSSPIGRHGTSAGNVVSSIFHAPTRSIAVNNVVTCQRC